MLLRAKETVRWSPPLPAMIPGACAIRRVVHETRGTFTFELAAGRSSRGFMFSPGQFNMLYVYGVGEVPVSISGDPDRSDVLVHTVRSVGIVTKAMQRLRKGDSVGVRGPYGTAWPLDHARGKDVVVVAGGIGLAPLRPAIYRLLAERDQYGTVSILYGTRTPADILYQRELEKWRSRFDLEVSITVDRAMTGWKGSVGVVTTLISKASFHPAGVVAMICGPEVMMRFTVAELQKRGVKQEDIYVSLERNMKCGIGICGHCQYGPVFICKDGPVFALDRIKSLLSRREL
jgi:NAD(P)H-flavin reductase